MKQITFANCTRYEDIEAAIHAALEYDVLVENEAAARQWFKTAGIEGDVISCDIVNTCVSVWNEEMNGEEKYSIRVIEHYVDSGSADYVYSCVIA